MQFRGSFQEAEVASSAHFGRRPKIFNLPQLQPMLAYSTRLDSTRLNSNLFGFGFESHLSENRGSLSNSHSCIAILLQRHLIQSLSKLNKPRWQTYWSILLRPISGRNLASLVRSLGLALHHVSCRQTTWCSCSSFVDVIIVHASSRACCWIVVKELWRKGKVELSTSIW